MNELLAMMNCRIDYLEKSLYKNLIVTINDFHKKFILPSSNTGNILMFQKLQNQLIQSIQTAK